MLEIDSTFCKVHQNATGALKKLGMQAIGVSRGGKTTKIHALVNENFQLINVILTGGNVHDSECVIDLLSAVEIEGKTVLADKVFASEYIRSFIVSCNAVACIPTRLLNILLTKNCIKAEMLLNVFFSA